METRVDVNEADVKDDKAGNVKGNICITVMK